MKLLILALSFSFLFLACSPQPNPKEFGDRDQYRVFGPKTKDVLLDEVSFTNDFEKLKTYRGWMPSSQLFDSASYIYQTQMLDLKQKEARSHRLAFRLREEAYELKTLSEIITKRSAKKQEAEALEKLYHGVVYRKAYGLSYYMKKLKKLLSAEEWEQFSFEERASYKADLIELSEVLSQTRFLTGVKLTENKDFLQKYHSLREQKTEASAALISLGEFLGEEDLYHLTQGEYSELHRSSFRLLDSFYSEPKNFSQYSVENSAYVEAALGLYGADVYQAWSSTFQRIRIQVKEAFRRVKLVIPKPEGKDLERPEKVVQNLKEQLNLLSEQLLDLGVEPIAVDQVRVQISALDPLIYYAVDQMSRMQIETRLEDNITFFDGVIARLEEEKLFPATVISTVREEVLFPEQIQRLIRIIEQKGTSHELRLALSQTILIRIWRYLRSQVEKELGDLLSDKYTSSSCRSRISDFTYQSGRLLGDFDALAEECGINEIPAGDFEKFIFKTDRLLDIFGADKRVMVYALYILMNEKDLDWLARVDDSNLELQDSIWDYTTPVRLFVSNRIKSIIESMADPDQEYDENSIERVRPYLTLIEQAVNRAFLKKVSLRLADELGQFDKVVEKSILDGIDKVDLAPDDFYSHLKRIARAELGGKILDNLERQNLPLYEAGELDVAYGLDGWSFRNTQARRSYFYTSASALTSSASAAALSFWQFAKAGPNEDVLGGLKKRSFDLVNKLVSLLGVRDYFGRLKPGLIINGKSRIPKRLDIYTYAYETEFFGIPDSVFLNANDLRYDYSLLPEERSFSLDSQARTLQMAVDFANLMSDWETSPLDQELHTIQYQNVDFFSKESLIELGLGMASIPLRNLMKGSVKLFDANRDEILFSGKDPDEVAASVSSAVIVSLVGESTSSKVDTASLARYMIALKEFITVAERIGFSRSNSLIYKNAGTGKSVLGELETAADLLKKLYIAMSNFLSSRLMNEEFAFLDSYDLNSRSAGSVAPLSTQLLARQALMNAYDLWNAEVYLWAVVDNYYFTNKHFLSKETGLYRSDTDWPPYLLSLSMYSLKKMEAEPAILKLMSEESQKLLRGLRKQQQKALTNLLE